jgi:hypothetical protein
MDSDVASPVSASNVLPIRAALDASQHLLVINTVNTITTSNYPACSLVLVVKFI